MAMILIPRDTALCKEVAALLEKELVHYPMARLMDIVVDMDPDKLGTVDLTVRSVMSPQANLQTRFDISVLRAADTRKNAVQQMLVAIATIDLRQKKPPDGASVLVPPPGKN